MDKTELLNKTRDIAGQCGGTCRVEGKNNKRKRHIHLQNATGQKVSIWYPVESRVNALEVYDLKEAVKELFGKELF